jgi:hypothetical protein|tara:strand:- start:176 stop:394 length:219 start_codon:yes stop_codon:yes gene_type:complete
LSNFNKWVLQFLAQPNNKKSEKINQNNFLYNGLKVELRTSEVLINGKNSKITTAPPIAATPPSLSGIEHRIA